MQILLLIIVLAVFFNYNEVKIVKRRKSEREDYRRRPSRPRYEHERFDDEEDDHYR